MKKYSHIVSLGSMCSVALYLREKGFREGATIFDWFKSNLRANFLLIDNHFANLLNRKNLVQKYENHPEIVDNTLYGISISHIFDETSTFKSQIKRVEKIINKRIQRFYKYLSDGNTLCVYYCNNEEEWVWIKSHQKEIYEFAKKFSFDLLFLTNFYFDKFDFPVFHFDFNSKHDPYGGGVTFPFPNDEKLDNYLKERYEPAKMRINLKQKENRGRLVYRVFRKMRRILGITRLKI